MAAIVDLIKLDKLISAGRQRVILPKQLRHQIYLKTHVWRTRKQAAWYSGQSPAWRQDLPQGPLWARFLSIGTGVHMTGESMPTGWERAGQVQDSHQETSLFNNSGQVSGLSPLLHPFIWASVLCCLLHVGGNFHF